MNRLYFHSTAKQIQSLVLVSMNRRSVYWDIYHAVNLFLNWNQEGVWTMSNCWINWRFGTRHLQIGKWFITFEVNHYLVENPPAKWFEIY